MEQERSSISNKNITTLGRSW